MASNQGADGPSDREGPPELEVPRSLESTPADEITMARGWRRPTSFDLPSAAPVRPTTLRWVVTHLIEDITRHLGHTDITRELLDGRTGR